MQEVFWTEHTNIEHLHASQDQTLIKPLGLKNEAGVAGNFLGEFAVVLFTSVKAEVRGRNFYQNYEKLAKEQKRSGKNLIGTEKLVKYGVVENKSVRNRGDRKISTFGGYLIKSRWFLCAKRQIVAFPVVKFDSEKFSNNNNNK